MQQIFIVDVDKEAILCELKPQNLYLNYFLIISYECQPSSPGSEFPRPILVTTSKTEIIKQSIQSFQSSKEVFEWLPVYLKGAFTKLCLRAPVTTFNQMDRQLVHHFRANKKNLLYQSKIQDQ